MNRRKSKTVIIAVVVLTVFVGVAATVIAYLYSRINDVTPGQSSANAAYCSCYILPKDIVSSCPGDGNDALQYAVFTNVGTVTNGACSARCQYPSLSADTLRVSTVNQCTYLGPKIANTCAEQYSDTCGAGKTAVDVVGGNTPYCNCCTDVSADTTKLLTCTGPTSSTFYGPSFDPTATRFCSNLSIGDDSDHIYTSPIDANMDYINVYAIFTSYSQDFTSTTIDPSLFQLTVNGQTVTQAPSVVAADPSEGIYRYDAKWRVPKSYIASTATTLNISATINSSTMYYAPCDRVFSLTTSTPPTPTAPTCNSFTITPTSGTTGSSFTEVTAGFTYPDSSNTRAQYKLIFRDSANNVINTIYTRGDWDPKNGENGILWNDADLIHENFRTSLATTDLVPFPKLPAPTGTKTTEVDTVELQLINAADPTQVLTSCQKVNITVNSSPTPAAPACHITITPTSSNTGTLTVSNIAITGTNLPQVSTANPHVYVTFAFPGSTITSLQNKDITTEALAATNNTINLTSTSLTAMSFPTFQSVGTGTNPTTYNVAGTLKISDTSIICDPAVTLSVTPQDNGNGAKSNFTVSKIGPKCFERVAPNNAGTFSITVTNAATDSQQLRSFKDKLPLGFTYVTGSTTINETAAADSGLVTVNTVGSSQEITWNRTGGWSLTQGEVMVVTFRATAGTSAITGNNQNEVVLDPVNTPTVATSIRTEYVFTVASNCSTPKTGIFDETGGKIGIGLIVLIIGVIFYYTSFGINISKNIAITPVAKGATKASEDLKVASAMAKLSVKDKAQMTWLKIAYPTKYFEEKTMRSKLKKNKKK